MKSRSLLTTSAAVLMLASVSASDHWPQFRGVEAGVAADDPALPETWSTTQNVVWSLDVPGLGWSSPVAWGDQIFITSVISSGKVAPPQRGLYAGTLLYDSKVPHRWMVMRSRTADAQVLRWDEREAPQREIARQKKEADDTRASQWNS